MDPITSDFCPRPRSQVLNCALLAYMSDQGMVDTIRQVSPPSSQTTPCCLQRSPLCVCVMCVCVCVLVRVRARACVLACVWGLTRLRVRQPYQQDIEIAMSTSLDHTIHFHRCANPRTEAGEHRLSPDLMAPITSDRGP